MNDKDKQEFEKWFKDFYEVDFNVGNHWFMGQSIAWKYACEFKQKEIDILKNHDIAGYKEGIDCLQAENKKLREALEFYADTSNPNSIFNPDYDEEEDCELIESTQFIHFGKRAREALKEVGEER